MSYGTFTPYHTYYAIDSEYLKSLISSKELNENDGECELNESASFSPDRDVFPTTPLTAAEISPPPTLSPSSKYYEKVGRYQRQDSGLGRSCSTGGGNRSEVGQNGTNGILPESQQNAHSSFFAECEQQVLKLFSYMEVQLSHVEQQIEIAMNSKQVRHSKRTRRHYATSLSSSEGRSLPVSINTSNDDILEQNLDGDGELASDSGVDDRSVDFEELGLLSVDREQESIEKSIGVLSQLKEIVLNLQASLNNNLASLNHLLGIHDDRMLSQEGQVSTRCLISGWSI